MKKFLFLFFSFFLLIATAGHSQNETYRAYIAKHEGLAVEQMHRHGIPASITLAQGLLESAAGQSYLARKANNHFGIKTGGTWTGPYIIKDDDYAGEHFRVYRNVNESYEDHSLFLKTRKRYASLFTLSPTDYKGWARGLKSAGYATNPQYAERLIELIERYELHRYDLSHPGLKTKDALADNGYSTTATNPLPATGSDQHTIRRCNGNYYIIAAANDTYSSIAKWAGVREQKLRKYNEVPRKAPLTPGEIVFLEKKRTKAARALGRKVHIINAGESLHDIAQHYGMRVKTLYKNNKLSDNYVPKAGDALRIR